MMMVGSNIKKKVAISKFAKLIRLLSKVYVIPLRYNSDFTEVKFSVCHWKTFVCFLVQSIPLSMAGIWWTVFQRDFFLQYLEEISYIYSGFDLSIILFVMLNFINPSGMYRYIL